MSNSSAGKNNTFFGGAAILAAGIVIVKLIGALYKLPLGRILSTAAFSDFNSAYYIYSLLIVISTGGLPVALSKMVSEANTLGRHNQVQKTFRLSMIAFAVMGIVSFCIMFFFPGPLSKLLNNSRSYYSILALAPAAFFICPLSAFRGYFQGHSYMTPTAVSQIIEALCKLAFGLALAAWLVRRTDESVAAAGAIVGVSIGCGMAFLYMFLRYLPFRRKHREKSHDVPDDTGVILRRLARLAVPITLGSSVVAIVTLVDTSLVFSRLQFAAGFTENEARALKGVYDLAIVPYNLPASLMVSLTSSVIPAISACRARRDRLGAGRIAESSLRVASLIAFPAGTGLSVLATPIMTLFYPDRNPALGGWILSLLGVASVAVCLMLVSTSILQANGFVNLPILVTAVGSSVKIVSNYVLVGNPQINIKGAPIGTILCFGIIALINLGLIARVVPAPPRYGKVFLKPLIASVVMGAGARGAYGLLAHAAGLGNSLSTLGAIAVGVVVYFVLVLALRAISSDDLALMPKGDKIARVLKIR
mgnify:CR=1 FL=1